MSRRPPAALDRRVAALRGRGVAAAEAFTLLGRTYPLLAVGALAAFAGRRAGRPVTPVLLLLASQTLSQGAVAILKARFGRRRPELWLVRIEAGLSYPSGHAVTALVFYAPLAALAFAAAAPGDGRSPAVRGAARAAGLAAAACAAGIPWSRIVLGAHYATDVLGGLLFGAAWTLVRFSATRR